MAIENWNVDTAHSAVNFSIRHMVISKVRGRFTKWSAAIAADEAKPSASSVSARIEVASIDTSEAQRDTHLRSPDFFDAEKFPEITFKSKKVDGKGGNLYRVVGDLTMHGVTKEVALDVEHHGKGKDPWGNERVGFSAKTSLDRKDFGLQWNQVLETGGVLVGEKVEVEIELEAIKAKA